MSKIICKQEPSKYNPIGFLQEFSQKHKEEPTAVYAECRPSKTGKFTCKCIFGSYEVTCSSSKKKVAKSEAAERMIALLDEDKYFDKFKTITRSALPKTDPPVADSLAHCGNAVNALHYYSQMKKLKYPEYSKTTVPGGGILFMCTFNGKESYGYSNNKKSAKTKAALKMCKLMNITFDTAKKQTTEDDDFPTVKDAVTALKEVCQLLKSQDSQPIYENKPTSLNSYEVVCTVGGITGEGKNLTNNEAKMSAAKEVLRKLSRHDLPTTQEFLRDYLVKKEVQNDSIDEERVSNITKTFGIKYKQENYDMANNEHLHNMNHKKKEKNIMNDLRDEEREGNAAKKSGFKYVLEDYDLTNVVDCGNMSAKPDTNENKSNDLMYNDENRVYPQIDNSENGSQTLEKNTVVISDDVHDDQENPIRDAILNWLENEQKSSKGPLKLEDIYQSDEENDTERGESNENSISEWNNEMTKQCVQNYAKYGLQTIESSLTNHKSPAENNSICDTLLTWMQYNKKSSQPTSALNNPKENEVKEYKHNFEDCLANDNGCVTHDNDHKKQKNTLYSNIELPRTSKTGNHLETKYSENHPQNLDVLPPKDNSHSLTGTLMILLYWLLSLLNWFSKRPKLRQK